jgi:FlaA1/EpsC-like NDP-sugar epimerase
MNFPDRNVARWIIFLIDIAVVTVSLFVAYMLRFEFTIPVVEQGPLIFAFPVYMIVRISSFLIGSTYAGIIRYTGTKDSTRLIKVILAGSLLMALFNPVKYYFWDQAYFLPYTIIILDCFLSSAALIGYRLLIKMIYVEYRNPRSERQKVIIYGAGEAGVITKRTLDRDAGTSYEVVAFVDDNADKSRSRVEGASVFHTSALAALIAKYAVTQVIISIQKPNPENRRRVIESALAHNARVLNVPPVHNWINGELSFRQIRQVKIDDLLGREAIMLDQENVAEQLRGKVVLITGAAGSIGSELVRQIAGYSPLKLIALDQAESPLYDLENELRLDYPSLNLEVVIGDIRRENRMARLFEAFKPEVVYHAAAYKHVPLMELNPSEAVLTNVLGTRILVDLSIAHGVESFVFISTDKAVNPTSVMGSTKRVAEIYAQSCNGRSSTRFITTRFGNVLGSNGSVIPLFKKQIEAGGPLTITHPEVTRYFMTIPEACRLVLEAGAMGEGGEIFVFDMGESVKIIDLARQMIKLSGLEPEKDIEIQITGLRPGEKLYEELLNNEENTLPTHHPQIKRAAVRPNNFDEVSEQIAGLIDLFDKQDNDLLVQKIKSIVPEFRSNNSEFSKFDA